jgi:hypothetical protein
MTFPGSGVAQHGQIRIAMVKFARWSALWRRDAARRTTYRLFPAVEKRVSVVAPSAAQVALTVRAFSAAKAT